MSIEELYETGALLMTRKTLWGLLDSNGEVVCIPYKSIVILLGRHCTPAGIETVKLLCKNRIIFITDVDMGHDFRVCKIEKA